MSWPKGKRRSPETIRKMSVSLTGRKLSAEHRARIGEAQRIICSDPEERKRRSERSILVGRDPEERQRRSVRAKARGYGKWMLGRPSHPKRIAWLKAQKGKSFEERFGSRAAEIKRKISESNKRAKRGKRPSSGFLTSSVRHRKGKTYAQIYGIARAAEESKKRSLGRRRRWQALRRHQYHRPRGQGCGPRYRQWRHRVFERDNYICQRCGRQGGKLQANHIKPWALFPRLRYDVKNGETLCAKPCHKEATKEQRRLYRNMFRENGWKCA